MVESSVRCGGPAGRAVAGVKADLGKGRGRREGEKGRQRRPKRYCVAAPGEEDAAWKGHDE